MARVEMGDRIRVYYRGILENDHVVDETPQDEPFEFEVGEGVVFLGLDEVVVGMDEGEVRSVVLSPERAFGAYNPELVIELERSKFPPDTPLKVGTQMEVQSDPNGTLVEVTVTGVTEETVTLDANHSLAGEEVTLWVHVLEIVG
ncbi:MAG: FKBP-type peptidyl-prolyl cis-trans isomerase [bacterium]|nr:FKBP-type peptidyl-prolyl cis-trans isomerase [bacterium]